MDLKTKKVCLNIKIIVLVMPRVVKGILECMLVPPSSDTLQLIASLEKDVSHMGTEWEKSHVKALSHLGQRNMASAVQTWDEILTNYPTDPLALKIATDSYFWLGDGKNIRACVEKTMPSWKASTPCYRYLLLE